MESLLLRPLSSPAVPPRTQESSSEVSAQRPDRRSHSLGSRSRCKLLPWSSSLRLCPTQGSLLQEKGDVMCGKRFRGSSYAVHTLPPAQVESKRGSSLFRAVKFCPIEKSSSVVHNCNFARGDCFAITRGDDFFQETTIARNVISSRAFPRALHG